MAAPTTTAKGIVLTLSPYSLELTIFGSRPGRYPRIDGEYTRIARSLRGSAARRGPVNRPFAIWDFEARLSLDQQEVLKRMEASYWANRRAWMIYDYTNYWGENGVTRTRAIAPNSTAASDGTTLLYYPQWNAEPTNQNGFEWTEQSDGFDLVSFQFTETGVVAA